MTKNPLNFMKKTIRSLTKEFPNIIRNKVSYHKDKSEFDWMSKKFRKENPEFDWLSTKVANVHVVDVALIIGKHYTPLTSFYDDPQIALLMGKLIQNSNDMFLLAMNTLFYAPVELNTKAAKKSSSANASADKAKAM